MGSYLWGRTELDTTEVTQQQQQQQVLQRGFPGGSVVKNPLANAGDSGSNPGQKNTMEKKMATYSSIFAGKNPRTEEPGRLQSTGCQKVRHNLVTEHEHLKF